MLVSDQAMSGEAEVFAAIVGLLKHKDALTCKTGCQSDGEAAKVCWACRVQRELEAVLDRVTARPGNSAHVYISGETSWVDLYLDDESALALKLRHPTSTTVKRRVSIRLTDPPQYAE